MLKKNIVMKANKQTSLRKVNMSYKYNRQIRKVMNGNYRAAFEQVRVYIEAKARSANFFQRFRIAMRYLFKKDFNSFL